MQVESSITLPRGSEKIVEIPVGSVKVKVKTDATPASLKQIRDLLETRFESFAGKIERQVNPAQVLALVALSLAEEVLDGRERVKTLKRTVTEKTDRALERVEFLLAKE
jgi:hypothetical protein